MKNSARLHNIGRTRLQPLIDYVASKHGAGTDIQRRLKEKTGVRYAHHQVMGWLKPDKAEWIMPNYGVGLVLEEVWSDIQKEQTNANAKISTHAH